MPSQGILLPMRLDNLLKRLNIPNYKQITNKLLLCENFYFNKYFNNYQVGGGKAWHTNLKFKGFNFRMNIIRDPDRTTFSIVGDHNLDCVVIFINHGTNYAVIHNISNIKGCIIAGQVYKRGGSLLLQLIITFLKKNKTDFKIKRAVLTDNSFKYCKGDIITLSRMYILSTGHTWYGKYGFRPYDSQEEEPDRKLLKLYNQNYQIMKNAKVKDVKNLKKIIIRGFNKLKPKNINLNNILNVIDMMQEKKLTKFIKMFLKDYDKYCKLFKEVELDIYTNMRLYNFHRNPFYLDL